MNHRTTRRGTRLAATMTAAGLVLAAAPQAVAADDDGAMILTSAQAEDLAARVHVDVYGDDAPEEPAERDDAETTDTGETGDGSASTQAEGDPVTFTQESALEGVQGMGVTAAAGDDGDYFTLHSLGNVQRHAADGATTWTRTTDSLYAEWGVRSWRPWETELYRPHLVLGYNAVSPFAPQADQGYDTGDLSGDGVEDLVFSTSIGTAPPGWSAEVGTHVTVLDGATGATLWTELYDHVAQVKVVDGTLVLADAPAANGWGDGGTATLTGMRFSAGDGGTLTPADTWTHDTGTTDPATWAAIEDLGDGSVAAVWDLRKTDANAARGRTLVLDVADGTVRWQTDSDLYGRQLHLDASRDRLVALEQADPTDGVRYQIASYDLASGERATLDTRVNALPTAMTLGDLKKGGGPEYAVSESTLSPYRSVNAATVRVLDGDRPDVALWSHTTKRDPANGHDGPSSWELTVVDGSLVVSSQDDADLGTAKNIGGLRYGALTVLTGSGKVRWHHDGVAASPMAHEVVGAGGDRAVRTIDLQQNVRTYNLGNGTETDLTPLRGDMWAAQAVDVDGDGNQDVVAGGTSDGVWAWSGTSLTGGEPEQLWQAAVGGQVHGIETGDVDGDGDAEVVVAADTVATVLDVATGDVVATIDGQGGFVRSVTVADVDGDGADEILVPTDALRVYRGDGSALWTYAAPAAAGDVIFSDTVVSGGRVHTQYGSVDGLNRDDATQQAVALDESGAVLWTADPEAPEIAEDGLVHGALLRNAVFAAEEIPYADGHAVVHTWLMQSRVPGFPDTAVTPHVFIEIRDGRTGELLYQSVGGSPWSHDNYLTVDDVLYQLSFGTLHGFAADGVETYASVTAPLRSVALGTGPGGRELLLGGVEGGVGAWDPAVLTSGWSFQHAVGSALQYGGRNALAADLDGDGVDEMLSLNFDDFGVHRTAALLGGGVFAQDNGIHRMVTYSLS